MSLIQKRCCDTCKASTYHKLFNGLKSPLISKSYWECAECRSRTYVDVNAPIRRK